MKIIIKVSALLGCVSLVSCSGVLDVAGVKYRTKAGPMVSIGDVGYKNKDGKSEIIPFDKYQPTISGMVPEVRTVMQTASTEKRSAKLGVTGYGKAGASRTGAEKGKFKIYSLRGQWINSFYAEMNKTQNKKSLANLKRWGSDARMVVSVAKAFDYEKTKTTTIEAESEKIKVGTTEGQVSVSNETSSVLKFSDGTNIAYEMCRLAWGQNADGEWVIEGLIPDRPGFDKKELERQLEDNGWSLNPGR